MKITKELVARVRKEMNTQGWSLVDTRELVPDIFGHQRINLHIEKIGNRIAKLVRKSLPNEKLFKYGVSQRINPAHAYDPFKGTSDDVYRWHTDGGYIRTMTPIEGETTKYRMSKKSRKVLSIPLGWTLIITAGDRGRTRNKPCTIHRSPNGKKRRLVVLDIKSKKSSMLHK